MKDIIFAVISMGYLICDECGGYYELQEGESPEDFGQCKCGGHLRYVEKIENPKFKDKLFSSSNIKRITGILVGAVIILLSFFIFSPDPFSSSFAYNSQTSFYIWAAGGLAAAVITGGNIKSGASNGFYSASIAGLIVIITFYMIINNYFINSSLADNFAFFMALFAVYILVPAIFSMVGGIIGILARKTLGKLV